MTIQCFVAGWPIDHSLSPLLHTYWIKKHGLDGSYEAKSIEPENFHEFLTNVFQSPYAGGNITLPFKLEAHKYVSRRDGAAKTIGAVNTVWLEQDRLIGGNTDAYGFAANMDDHASHWRNVDTALVLGAGGASPAILYALLEAGISHIHLANRTVGRARTMAERFGERVSFSDLEGINEMVGKSDLVINATSHGMAAHGEVKPLLPLEKLPDHGIVADIVYTPLETPLLASARGRGLEVVDGLGMLLHQAVPGFERWFGVRPEVTTALREYILAQAGLK